MQVLRTIAALRAWRLSVEGEVGFVPTMGFLHEGHLSLVRAARKGSAHTVVSIFVNPTQFSPSEDLARYPRDEARDLALLEAEGVQCVFIPGVAEMYPEGFSSYVSIEGMTSRLEGQSRPAHFRGVTTIVLKLLHLVQPDRAYFGRKDAQQLAVVRRMVRDLDLPVDIVGLPIVREPDGLALSSRNVYLTPAERAAAPVLCRALRFAERMHAAGERSAAALREAMHRLIAEEPLAVIDYLSVADPESIEELDRIDASALVSLAVRFGASRLIDNTNLGPA